jgi:ABC-type multidrug transport system permease subunit
MLRVSPFTYFTGGILGAGLSNADIVCAANEYLQFTPPPRQTCGQYMASWIFYAGGYLQDTNATSSCSFCAISSTNAFLANFGIYYSDM